MGNVNAICRFFKTLIRRSAAHNERSKKIKPEDVERFEKIFYEKFNRQLAKHGAQCYDQAVIKCEMLQKEDRFLNCPDVQKMKFCQKWWQRFQKDRGMRWKKICSNRQTFTNNEVEVERERLREIMIPYQDDEVQFRRDVVFSSILRQLFDS